MSWVHTHDFGKANLASLSNSDNFHSLLTTARMASLFPSNESDRKISWGPINFDMIRPERNAGKGWELTFSNDVT